MQKINVFKKRTKIFFYIAQIKTIDEEISHDEIIQNHINFILQESAVHYKVGLLVYTEEQQRRFHKVVSIRTSNQSLKTSDRLLVPFVSKCRYENLGTA